jgi:iron complex outermembrane recepter protein
VPISEKVSAGPPFQAGCAGLRIILLLLACPAACGQSAQSPSDAPGDLTQVSIENLMNMEVTSVSKKEQKISQVAAAIFVISQEDIRRSGVTSIPELLRMVPGLEVAHIDASKWAVSARGFNDRFADKLLVLIDGRSLYKSPSQSGVFWEVQNVMLGDIERIEVIRGPGATLWSPGAVNGVINIITKKAKDTAGALASTGGGVQERGFGEVRYGGRAGGNGDYRVYGGGFDRGPFVNDAARATSPRYDGWHMFQSGFRTDWQLSKRDALTVEGDVYQGDLHRLYDFPLLTPPFSQEVGIQTVLQGGDVLARWTRTYSTHSDMSLQVYYNADTAHDPTIHSFAQSLDFDFQNRFLLGKRHDIVWGLGYRYTESTFDNTFALSFLPPSQGGSLSSAFAQDEITIVPDRLHFIVGVKFQRAPYDDNAVLPNGRLLWTPTRRQTVWTSISTAERTPDRADRGLVTPVATFPAPDGTPVALTLLGNPNTGSEQVLAFEWGYRVQPVSRLSIDLATFYNRYKNLSTNEPGIPFLATDPSPAHLVMPIYFSNQMHGKGFGAELAMGWQATSNWRLNAGYSYLGLNFRQNPGSLDNTSSQASENNPRHQVQLRSQWNLPRHFEFDQSVYFVGTIGDLAVREYTRADVRLGWRPTEAAEISVVGQNLLSPRHLEFIDSEGTIATQDVRKVFGKIVWRF